MTKYLAPLVVFVMGNLILLVVFLLLPIVGTAGVNLASETEGMASTFWNWTWVVGNVKLLVFLVFNACVLYATARAFLKAR